MKHTPLAIAVRIIMVGDRWTCRCAACSYAWVSGAIWVPDNITDFNKNLRRAYQHLKTCPKPITWKPTKGCDHSDWIVRFL